ncbi:hypothetical protein [Sphingomonas sp.]|uniref:hypothetical protein n=1 Tax=Sphingomonas sp. TaxID=28214 RepID=UPI0031E223C3
MTDEYPKAIYKDGGDELIWGEPVQTSAVHSDTEEREALAKGWRLHPLKFDPLDHDRNGHKGGSMPGRRGRRPKVMDDGDAGPQ